jgi:Protein of unknown function (DUF2384)
MDTIRKQAPASLPPIVPDQRRDPKIRREMSGPALRTFFNVVQTWQLSSTEQRALLGWPAESTFFKYKTGETGTLSFDLLMRISLVLGIYKDLHILYPEADLANRWIKLPNNNPLFGGRPPLAFLMDAGMDGLYQLRRMLDGRRGG